MTTPPPTISTSDTTRTSDTSVAANGRDPVTDSPVYLDRRAAIGDRVHDLLERMTPAEKLAQLGSAWVFEIASDTGLDLERATPLLANGIGHVTRMSGASSLTSTEAATLANELQLHLVDNTRLGIPAIVHEEICSGLMAREATSFPQAIGVASTFRPEHNTALADAIRMQMRSIGAHHGLSPVLDVCRDPRWGRMEESYGEDPFLVSLMGISFVRGLQGDDLADGVVATAKHFVGYGASEGGMNWAPAHIPERELRDVYLRPFEAAVREAGIASVMNAYHELDGVPCGASRWLLTELLRDDWGFEGTVVSDYFAIRQLEEYHRVALSAGDAAVTALTAGIDVELPGTDCFGEALAEAIATGALAMADVDLAVSRVLDSKFRLGLFEGPFVDVERVAVHTRSDAQISLAGEMARDSLVLLKNDGVLPLASPSSVALLGPNAASARNLLGDYSYVAHVESLVEVLKSGQNVFAMPLDHGADIDADRDLSHITTVADELADRMASTKITTVTGCDVIGDDRSGFDEAVRAASDAEVAVLVMGERSGLTEDCTTGESRDVASLDLPGVQEDFVLAVAATGTPVVLVLVAGRPIGSEAVHAAADAVLVAWLPGEQGGAAIADALTGVFSPGGKLPVTHPRSSGQIPIFYGHKISGGRSHWKGSYVDLSNEPMYPFGHGIGYSTFDVDVEPLDGAEVVPGGDFDVAVTVSNTGGCVADEVVQLYSRDPVAAVTRPVLELQGFARVTLAPGETACITFHVAVDALGFSGPDLAYVVEPGTIEFFAGPSSVELHTAGHVVVGGTEPALVDRRTRNAITIEPVTVGPVTFESVSGGAVTGATHETANERISTS